MSDKFDGAIEKLINHIDNTIVFTQEQMPEVAVEMINYGLTINTYGAIASGIFCLIFFVSFLVAWFTGYAGERMFFSSVVFIIAFVFCFIFTVNLKKIELAPRLYVLESVRNLIK